MNGYHDLILDIDLSTGRVQDLSPGEEFYKKYLGGATLAAALVNDRIEPGLDPFGPDNPLVMAVGPFVGTSIPMVSRYAVAGISPLTGYWGESTSGGKFPFKLKGSGVDALVFTGQADKPVYLHVKEGKAEVKDASHLWGKDSYETQEILKGELGEKIAISCIGKAGENQVAYASVMNDEGRAAGRCGFGALMGSKNLKAVVCEGNSRTAVAQKDTLSDLNKESVPAIRGNLISMALREFGTSMYMNAGMLLGDVPSQYFTKTIFPAEKVDGRALLKKYRVSNYACQGCIVGCGRVLKDVAKDLPKVDGPEYETLGALGPLCGNLDLDTIIRANHLCNCFGMDTISTGVSIAYAIYLSENGVIDTETTGIPLKWEDGAGVLKLLEMIAAKEGFGELVGKGTLAMARELGRDEGEAAQVKGLEVPMHDPRAFAGQALSYATGPRGACHLKADYLMVETGGGAPEYDVLPGDRFATDRVKVESAAKYQAYKELFDAAAMCKFAPVAPTLFANYLNAVTGWELDSQSLLQMGMRSLAIKRMISAKLGLTPADDTLPAIVNTPMTEGMTSGVSYPIEDMVKEYYDFMGWDPTTGVPDESKIAELGL